MNEIWKQSSPGTKRRIVCLVIIGWIITFSYLLAVMYATWCVMDLLEL